MSEENPKTILIEKTSKKLKMDLLKAQVFFGVLFLIGILILVFLSSSMAGLLLGGAAMVGSMIPLIIVKIKIWYHHE